VGVRLDFVQLPGECEQRRGLEGLLAPLHPQGVNDVELIRKAQVG
jgi:hypothetical protein